MLALVLVAVMCLSMGTVALAADDGSITIKSSEQGTTYNLYRILDLTGTNTTDSTDGTYDAISYTIATKWVNFFKGSEAGASYLVNSNTDSLNQINFDGTVYYLNLTDSNVAAFTNAAMKYAIDNNIATDSKATGTGNDIKVDNLALGYYLMVPVDASKAVKGSSTVASLTSTIPTAEVNVKALKPSIDKVDDKISADIGETVTYTVTGTVPNTAGYSTYVYKIVDTMTSGLTFQKDVKITIADKGDITTETGVSIDYTSNTNGFTASIPVASYQDYVGKTITLTYTAIVNDAAVSNTDLQEKNKVHLEYGHNPNSLEKTTDIEEEVYSTKIVINKYTGDSATGAKLANAKFALMDSDGKYYKYTAADETSGTLAKVEWVTVTGAPTTGTASVTDAMAKALADATTITTKISNDEGVAEFPGLADGTYYLVEYEAPNGYNRLATPLTVTVSGTDVDASNNNKTENKADATSQYDSKPSGGVTADVKNQTGSTLPSTGGIGTTIFYIVGAVLVLGAAVLLITKKRAGHAE